MAMPGTVLEGDADDELFKHVLNCVYAVPFSIFVKAVYLSWLI